MDNDDNNQTHLPANNSPAINAALDFSPDITYDQRNVKRPQGSAYDIGAVEVEAPCSFLFIKTPTGKDVAICLYIII